MSAFKLREPSDAQLTTTIAVVMIALGVVLRVQGIGAPPYFTFDERSFAPEAFHYLQGVADRNDHPPLGKLLMAVGYLLFGYTSVGWRFASLCLGMLVLVIAYWLGTALFGSRRAGLFGAACFAADGFFLAYTRCGLLDGMLVCFVLWGFLAAVKARTWRGVLSSVVLLGCATSIKWSGVMAVVPAAVAIWTLGRAPRFGVLALLLVPLVHAGIWMAALRLTGQRWDPPALWALMLKLVHAHLGRGDEFNTLASPWYTWPLLYHPIVVKLSSVGTDQRYASSVSNVVFFAAATLGVVLAPIAALGSRLSAAFRRRLPEFVDKALLSQALLLASGWLALLSPWMVARGKFTFMYHYLPSYGFALMLVAGVLTALERSHPRVVLVVFMAALFVLLYFMPVWSEFTVSTEKANTRLVFWGWKP
jgi:dolichyl-phosphate-mannose--protein O-mannosyl transferase